MEKKTATEVATISAKKTLVTTLVMAFAVAVLGGAAQFLTDVDVLNQIVGTDPTLKMLVPLFGMIGLFLKDWIKHL